MLKAKPRVIVICFWGGQENDHALTTQTTFRFLNELLTDALSLIFGVDREVCKIGNVCEIGH